MKKIIILIFIFTVNAGFAQQNLFSQVKEKIQNDHPEIKLDNKLIAVNVWSARDMQQREANIQLNKAATTFEFAKLKGGSKGIVAVVINSGDEQQGDIILNKDKASKLVRVNNAQLNINNVSNIIFDSNGNIIYSSLDANEIFPSIQKLITR
jgi:hypothetical protein